MARFEERTGEVPLAVKEAKQIGAAETVRTIEDDSESRLGLSNNRVPEGFNKLARKDKIALVAAAGLSTKQDANIKAEAHRSADEEATLEARRIEELTRPLETGIEAITNIQDVLPINAHYANDTEHARIKALADAEITVYLPDARGSETVKVLDLGKDDIAELSHVEVGAAPTVHEFDRVSVNTDALFDKIYGKGGEPKQESLSRVIEDRIDALNGHDLRKAQHDTEGRWGGRKGDMTMTDMRDSISLAIKIYMLQNPDEVPKILQALSERKPNEPPDNERLDLYALMQGKSGKQNTDSFLEIFDSLLKRKIIENSGAPLPPDRPSVIAPTSLTLVLDTDNTKFAAWTQNPPGVLHKGLFPDNNDGFGREVAIAMQENPGKALAIAKVVVTHGVELTDASIGMRERMDKASDLADGLTALKIKGNTARIIRTELRENSDPMQLEKEIQFFLLDRAINSSAMTDEQKFKYRDEVKRASIKSPPDLNRLDSLAQNLLMLDAIQIRAAGAPVPPQEATAKFWLIGYKTTRIIGATSDESSHGTFGRLDPKKQAAERQNYYMDILGDPGRNPRTRHAFAEELLTYSFLGDLNHQGNNRFADVRVMWRFYREIQTAEATRVLIAEPSVQRNVEFIIGGNRYAQLSDEAKARAENAALIAQQRMRHQITELAEHPRRTLMRFGQHRVAQVETAIGSGQFRSQRLNVMAEALPLRAIRQAGLRIPGIRRRYTTENEFQAGSVFIGAREFIINNAYPEAERNHRMNMSIQGFMDSIADENGKVTLTPQQREQMMYDMTRLREPGWKDVFKSPGLPRTVKRVMTSALISTGTVLTMATLPASATAIISVLGTVGVVAGGIESVRTFRQARRQGADFWRSAANAGLGFGTTFLTLTAGHLNPVGAIGVLVCSDVLMEGKGLLTEARGRHRAWDRIHEIQTTYNKRVSTVIKNLEPAEIQDLCRVLNVTPVMQRKNPTRLDFEATAQSIKTRRVELQRRGPSALPTLKVFSLKLDEIASRYAALDTEKSRRVSENYNILTQAIPDSFTEASREVKKAEANAVASVAAFNCGKILGGITQGYQQAADRVWDYSMHHASAPSTDPIALLEHVTKGSAYLGGLFTFLGAGLQNRDARHFGPVGLKVPEFEASPRHQAAARTQRAQRAAPNAQAAPASYSLDTNAPRRRQRGFFARLFGLGGGGLSNAPMAA